MYLLDRRRILVPPLARPLIYVDDDKPNPAVIQASTKSASSVDAARKIYLRTSLIPDSTGSAYVEHQQSKILALVNGPRSQKGSFSPTAKLAVDVKFLPISSDAHVLGIQQGGGFTTSLERTLADFIYASLVPSIRLGQYPKSGISVSVVVISGPPVWNGLVKQIAASCVTAASVAVVDAGIEVLDIVTACAVKFPMGMEHDVQLDLDQHGNDKISEEDTNKMNIDDDHAAAEFQGIGRGVVSYMAGRDEISGFWIDDESPMRTDADTAHSIEGAGLIRVLKTACDGAKEIRILVNAVLIQGFADQEEISAQEGKKIKLGN
ncbi:3' exoribonuclease family, domain 1-domain-containing protein [Lipomyces kononenkoae]|uniref:3' exoribonuclease family, domain 1-domain-containing protein n=1 Tax=Lipomyces kononenkoae TaxID=34357 RepID=A0ACC3SR38_LIPKO